MNQVSRNAAVLRQREAERDARIRELCAELRAAGFKGLLPDILLPAEAGESGDEAPEG